jgi:LemA family
MRRPSPVFNKPRGELSSALSRLLSVSENYPQLKADGLFRDLQAQLEGAENRIAVPQPLYQGRTGLQRHRMFLSLQFDGQGFRLHKQTQFHG